MKTTKSQIDTFLASNSIAIVGISRTDSKFSNYVFKHLKDKPEYKLFAIGKSLDSYLEETCYNNLAELPEIPEAVYIAIHNNKVFDVVKQAVELGIKNIWIQLGLKADESIELCKQNNINLIQGECILMFTEGSKFPHSWHRYALKLFNKYPK
jgi:uncharacterized protein